MIYKLNIRKVRLIRSCQSLVNGDTIYSGEYCQVFLSLYRLYIYKILSLNNSQLGVFVDRIYPIELRDTGYDTYS